MGSIGSNKLKILALGLVAAVAFLSFQLFWKETSFLQAYPNISGMARFEMGKFIVVNDKKDKGPAPWLGVLSVSAKGLIEYTPVPIAWPASQVPGRDIESLCAVPGTQNEFLLGESGQVKDETPGRLFHVRILKQHDDFKAQVLHWIFLPADTDNIEGMVCRDTGDGSVLLVSGERGGSKENPTGKLRWATIRLGDDKIAFSASNERKVSIDESLWGLPDDHRDIGDLYMDPQNVLWGVATQDPGDEGPFESVIYKLGSFEGDRIIFYDKPLIYSQVDGFKIEGLAAPVLSGSRLSIGTDDENLGAVWRPIY